MEIRQLSYFLAIARCGSFTSAANTLFVAQPALSVQINKLEGELGCALFDRGARGVRLTPAGEELLERAEPIIASIEPSATLFVQHQGTKSSCGSECHRSYRGR